MKTHRRLSLFLSFLACFGIVCCLASAQTPNQRLILKDGSYQIVKKYEILGDRVRYISAERDGDWEELPTALVDWPATKAWAKAHGPDSVATAAEGRAATAAGTTKDAPPASQQAAEIDKEAKAEREEATPTVAPGLRLPDLDGVFLLDTFQGEPELVDVPQNSGGLNTETPHNVLRALIPRGGSKQLITLEGYKAKAQLHVSQPTIYVSLDDGKANDEAEADGDALTVDTHGASSMKQKHGRSSPSSRYAIVRVQVKRETRVIGAMRLSALGAPQPSVDIVETTAEILPGGRWMKLTPKQPLEIDEYALVEMLSPKEINLAVWDFGINPRAPEAKNAISPVEFAK
jgi:hypothetical protein